MSSCKKNIIVKALSFWKNKLNESEQTTESEEDQKKEAAKEQGNQEQAEIDAADNQDEKYSPDEDFENSMSSDDSIEAFDTLSQDDDTESDDEDSDNEDSDEETTDTEDSDEDDDSEDDDSEDDDESGEESDDTEDGEESDDTEDGEESDDEDDSDEDDSDEDDSDEDEDEDDEEFKLEVESSNKKIVDYIPELCKKFGSKLSITISGIDSDDDEGRFAATIVCQDEETFNAVQEDETIKAAVSGELNESIKYTPNTVGAVVKLLNKSDPNDFLFIRLAPNMKQCMIYDIDRSIATNGQSTTYLEIAIGDPNK